jgi:hypothetical protein
VSFTSLPLHPRYPLDRRLGGPQSQSGSCGMKKNTFPLPGTEPWPSSPQPVTILSEVSRLHFDLPVLTRMLSEFGRAINCGKDCRVCVCGGGGCNTESQPPSNNAMQPLPRYPLPDFSCAWRRSGLHLLAIPESSTKN